MRRGQLKPRTALSENTKYSSLSQEVVRRLLHTSRRLPDSTRMDKLEELSQKMANSHHSLKFIKEILTSGIKSYTTKVKNSLLDKKHPEYKPLYMATNFKAVERWKTKQMAKENWYLDRNELTTKNNVDGGEEKP